MTKVRSPRLISLSNSHKLKRSGKNEESMVATYDDKNSTVGLLIVQFLEQRVHARPGPCPMLPTDLFTGLVWTLIALNFSQYRCLMMILPARSIRPPILGDPDRV